MSVIGSNILAGASGQGGGYNLTKSLRFRRSASATLSRTPSTSGNRKTWTMSFWYKRGIFGVTNNMLGCYAGVNDDANNFEFRFNTSDQLQVVLWNYLSTTSAVFRDPSAWYHIVLALDTTQAGTSSGSKIKVYVNGVLQSWGSDSISSSISQNDDLIWNSATTQFIGRWQASDGGAYFQDCYMAEVNFINGQALTPSSFGETSTSTGVWIPKKYTGTYGTNGFYLPFTDTTSTSTLGTDFSGNSNTWTVNNISLTSGSTYDSMNDVPTLTSATTANYSVINPLQNGGLTITNGNLTWAGAGSSAKCATGSIAMPSGKWYFEALITGSSGGNLYAGVCNLSPTLTSAPVSTSTGWGLMTGGGGTVIYKANNNTFTILSTTGVTGSVVSFAIDVDAGKIWFAQNGTWLEGSPSAGTGASYTNLTGTQVPFVAGYDSNDQGSINFGQRPFAYTPPTGFVALNTFNLPTPTIGATASTTANKYFDATLYTGNGSTQSITNSGSMQPDFVWMKSRSLAVQHVLQDVIRGTGSTKKLYSSLDEAENGANEPYGHLSAFNSNGFSVATGSINANQTNASGQTYVGWQWKANGTGVTNTQGSITSTVSANTTAGFSIVTYTGVGGSGTTTVGHGLGVAPSMVIIKRRNSTADWATYHTGLTSTSYYLFLNSTAGQANYGSTFISPSSSTLTIDAGSSLLNTSTGTYVAYCFAPVAGYSAFGSYTGNGDPNGAFVYLGFRPKFVLIKSTASGTNWVLHDSSREPFNEMGTNSIGYALNPENSVAESTNANLWAIDFTSNGFKNRSSSASVNSSGQTYIYMAFAENPFKYSNAR